MAGSCSTSFVKSTRPISGRIVALAALLAVVGTSAPRARAAGQELVGVVILMRHGVRAPLRDPKPLAPSRVWPAWPVVAYGDLTTHGEDLARRFGIFSRIALISAGVLTAPSCEAWDDRLYLYADVQQRTLRTAEGLLAGLAPQCGFSAHSLQGSSDPIFSPATAKRAPVIDTPALRTTYRAQLDALRRALGCCALDGRTPLAAASTAAEIFQLEYAQGMAVAWNRAGSDPGKFVYDVTALHVLDYALNERDAGVARERGSNLLAHISATLEQIGSQRAPRFTRAYRPPATSKVVVLVGHDTNQANVAALLGLHWTLAGYQRDEMPPGGALAFELRRCAPGRDLCILAKYRGEALDYMRRAGYTLPAARATGRATVVEAEIPIPGCEGQCTLARFTQLVAQKIDRKRVRL